MGRSATFLFIFLSMPMLWAQENHEPEPKKIPFATEFHWDRPEAPLPTTKEDSLAFQIKQYLEDQRPITDADGRTTGYRAVRVTKESSQSEKEWLIETFLHEYVSILGCPKDIRDQFLLHRGANLISLLDKHGVKINAVKHRLYETISNRCHNIASNMYMDDTSKYINSASDCASQIYEPSKMLIDLFLNDGPKILSDEFSRDGVTKERAQNWLKVESQDPLSRYSEHHTTLHSALSALRGKLSNGKDSPALKTIVPIECNLDDVLDGKRIFPGDLGESYRPLQEVKLDVLIDNSELLNIESELEEIVSQGVGREALYHAVDAVLRRGGLGKTMAFHQPRTLAYYNRTQKNKNGPAAGARVETAEFNSLILTVVDFSLSARNGNARKFIVDLNELRLKKKMAVAHGSGSDPSYKYKVTKFSDLPGQHTTTPGLYVTGEEYNGKHDRSMRLYGLDLANIFAYDDNKVVHAARYVKDGSECGRSHGCPAIQEKNLDPYLDMVSGTLVDLGKNKDGKRVAEIKGAPYYIYHPQYDPSKQAKR
ncbi:hypothetical protein GW915_06275 [bacterium]|nr:hypothetical protein [bacterium]